MRMPLSAMLVVGVVFSAPAGAETVREQSRRTVDIGDAATVAVENSRGWIRVRPSPDRSVHITAIKIVRAGDRDLGERLARETIVELRGDGSRYRIKVKYPRGRSVRANLWGGLSELTHPRVEVHLAVAVPARAAVELDAASADLFSEGLTGAQALSTASGDISVQSATGATVISTASGDISVQSATGATVISTASGDVLLSGTRAARVSTASGDVQIHGLRGPLDVSTANGDVVVAEATDSLHIQTASGDVRVARAVAGARVTTSSGEIVIDAVSDRLRVSSVSGEVRATLQAPLRSATISTSSGDVVLVLQENVGCTLEMQTSSGSIDVDVPSRTQTVTRQRVTAVVGQGAAPVALRTVSGNITVTRGGR